MNSQNLFTTILIAALAGAISAALFTVLLLNPQQEAPDANNSLRTRLDQLEAQLATEQQARRNLESLLTRNTSNKDATALIGNTQTTDLNKLNPTEAVNQTTPLETTPESTVGADPTQLRQQALLDAGFSEEDANDIVRRESAAALQGLQQQHKARRERLQQLADNNVVLPARTNAFREEIGEEPYERYLKSRGLPTQVDVATVLAGSPGEAAGLKFGDKITNYDSQRVFSIRELNQLTLLGNEGESVLVEFERDGQPMQITIPRGPIGITSNRQFQR